MADVTPDSSRTPPAGTAVGLRLRVWLACLAGPVVCSLGIWWVLGMFFGPYSPDQSSRAVVALIACSGAGLVIGAAFALWLDARLTAHARGLTRALSTRDIESLGELPARSGWGELSGLTHAARLSLDRERRLARAVDEAVQLEGQLVQVRQRLERWIETERWEALTLEDGPLAPLGATLDRGFARELELREQNQSVARLMREELATARDDARESVEQAERGFVEATALLTTVRELQRLGGELQGTLASPVSEAPPESGTSAFREAAARAIEELVSASIDSVDHLGAGLYHVQEIAEQVHAIANRSTLIALNAAVASGRGDPGAEELAVELKNLTREVRVATEKTDQLSHDVEREVRSASARMAEVRGRVVRELEAAPAPALAPANAPRGAEDVQRLMERVREMVQDATRKGERLSAAGERSSRAAQRLVRRLEEQLREFEGLVVRLGPAMALPEEPRAGDDVGAAGPAAGLRLLESERVGDDDSAAGAAEEKP